MDFLLKSVAAVFALWFLVYFLLVIHETGHLIALEHFNLKPDKVIIGNLPIFKINIGGLEHEFGVFPIFAFTISKDYAYAPHIQRAIVAIAGPLTSLLLGIGLYLVNIISPGWFTKIASNASFLLCFWNLIPLPPLDGWPILEWQLYKYGIKVNDTSRKVLLGLGILSIAILSVLSWD